MIKALPKHIQYQHVMPIVEARTNIEKEGTAKRGSDNDGSYSTDVTQTLTKSGVWSVHAPVDSIRCPEEAENALHKHAFDRVICFNSTMPVAKNEDVRAMYSEAEHILDRLPRDRFSDKFLRMTIPDDLCYRKSLSMVELRIEDYSGWEWENAANRQNNWRSKMRRRAQRKSKNTQNCDNPNGFEPTEITATEPAINEADHDFRAHVAKLRHRLPIQINMKGYL